MSNDGGYLHKRSNNYGKVPYELMTDTSISAGAVRLYAYMHWRYGSNMKNFESRESMAKAMGVSERTVTKYIAELEQADWVIVKVRNSKRGRQSNFYHVFELQEDCCDWRKKKKEPKPERTVEERKSRAGVGGKPTHNSDNDKVPQVNSSSHTPLNSSSHTPLNSSSDYPDSRSIQTHKEPKGVIMFDEPLGPPLPPQPKDIVDAWYDGMPVQPIKRKYDRNTATAKRILLAGYLPEQVKAFTEDRYKRGRTTMLKLEYVEDDLPLWVEQQKPPPKPKIAFHVDVPQWRIDAGFDKDCLPPAPDLEDVA